MSKENISELYDGKANADKRLALAATMTAYNALPTPPDSLNTGAGNALQIWLSNSTAAQGGMLCIIESTEDPATGALTRFVHEITVPADDMAFDPSDEAWGLSVGDTNAKNPISISVTKGSKITMFMSSEDGGAWYARYRFYRS